MEEHDLIPEVFFSLMDQADKLGELDEETMQRYYETLNDAFSFLPELVAVIGPDAFELLVKNYGGRTITIPSPETILGDVRKYGSK
jgi:hypothetical protein